MQDAQPLEPASAPVWISQPAPSVWMWHSPLITPEFIQWTERQVLSAWLAGLHPKRQTEYLAGRYALIQLYAAAGLPDLQLDDLPSQPDGQVSSPTGWICSVSHGYDRIVALVGPQAQYRGLGVDVEEVIQLRRCSRLINRVAPHDEQQVWQAAGLADDLGLTVTFSAKEALYKALTASVPCIMHFGQATLGSLEPGQGRLSIKLTCDLTDEFRAGQQFGLRYLLHDQEVLTLALLPQSA